MKKGRLFIVSAPSGAGKTTLTNHVVQNLGKDFAISKIITYTTRQPRQGEIDGIDYHFISPHEFKQKNDAGFFLEINEYNGNFYGSPRSIMNDLAQGKSFFIVVDRNGAKSLKKLIAKPILIWLTIPNLQTLQERMLNRESANQKEVTERLALANKELQDEERDHTFTHHVCNDNFEQAANEIMGIIRKELTLSA